MKQDITLEEVHRLKMIFEEKVQAAGIDGLAKEFYDKTGVRMNAVHIDWLDASQQSDPCIGYRMIPGKLWCDYEKVSI